MDKKVFKLMKNKLIDLRKKSQLSYFISMFILNFIIIHLLTYPFISTISEFNIFPSKILVKKYVNEKLNSGKQTQFIFENQKDVLSVNTIFYKDATIDGVKKQKAIKINMYLESYIPIIFLLSLLLADPVNIKKKLIIATIGYFVITLFIMFKINSMIFDNYSFPNYTLYNFEGLLGILIYYLNKILKTTGSSLNYIIVALLWFSLSQFAQDKIIKSMNII